MDRFPRAFELLDAHEGGYVNHPRDPGGATNRGVTQRTYDAWRRGQRLPIRSVRHITDDEVETIYRREYWEAVRGDELPPGVAYCVFDAAVNSGVSRASKWLQQHVGVKVDGQIGAVTLAATHKARRDTLIDRYCDTRLAFMKRLPHWPTFGRGWTIRVADVRSRAKSWAMSDIAPGVIPAPGQKPSAKAAEPIGALVGVAIAAGAFWLWNRIRGWRDDES